LFFDLRWTLVLFFLRMVAVAFIFKYIQSYTILFILIIGQFMSRFGQQSKFGYPKP